MRITRRGISMPVALLAVAALGLGACGNTSSSSSGRSTDGAVAAAAPATGCGSFTPPRGQDVGGELARLPQRYQDAYRGEPIVQKSAWINWKPSHPGPYSVAIVMVGAVNDLQVKLLAGLKQGLAASPMIGDVRVFQTQGMDIPQSLQQMAQAIRQRPDLILLEPIQPDVVRAAVEQAGKAGIPVVSFLSLVESPYAIGVNNNAYLQGARTASMLVRQIGGKGRLLFVHGYPTVPTDILELKATRDVLARCPGVKLAGEVVGQYTNAIAKSETLKFLATHPGRIDAVQQAGTMAGGVMSAFQSTGRAMPVVSDLAATSGSLSYWLGHRADYHSTGAGQGPAALAAATVSVALRTLAGQGPRLNKLLPPVPLITDANLSQWAKSGLPLTDATSAEGPRDAFLSEDYLNGLFTHGQPVK